MDDETSGDDGLQPPARLRGLASWQANKASILGARLTARHMPLTARSDFAILAALENLRCSSEGRVDLHFAAVAENLLCVEAVRVGGNGDVRAHNLDIY